MKLEMREDEHAWIVWGGSIGHQNEVIIDRERKDVRARFGNDIVKMQYDNKGLKGILVADIYVYQRTEDASTS